MPTSTRECYAGVGESAVYVAERARRRGVGKALLNTQVNGADAAGMWTLQASVFPENRASIVLHHAAGYRTLAVRERIAQLDASGATPSSWNGAARWSEPAAAALPAGQRKNLPRSMTPPEGPGKVPPGPSFHDHTPDRRLRPADPLRHRP